MASFSITIDDNVLKEITEEAKEGETKAQTIERLVVTAIGRLTATRKYAKAHAKPRKPKAAKKATKKAAKKASKPRKAKAPKETAPAPTAESTPTPAQ